MNNDFSVDDLNHSVGLSCIENYLIAILLKKVNNISELFAYSFYSFDDLYKDFMEKGVEYEEFYSVPRLQQLAQEKGIISYEIKDVYNSNEIKNEMKDFYVLLKVNPEFMLKNYKTKTWRDDHYIFLQKIDLNYIYYLNDYPKSYNHFSIDYINDFSSNRIVKIKILHNNAGDLFKANDDFFNRIIVSEDKNIDIKKLETLDIVQIRDMIGVLRVLRHRVLNYVECKFKKNKIISEDYIGELNKIYLQLEYMRIRRKFNIGEIQNYISSIREKDKKFLIEILKVIKNYS